MTTAIKSVSPRARREQHAGRPVSSVDVAPMADRNDHNHQPLVLDQGDDAVISDAIGPELGLVAAQRLSEFSRIPARDDALLQIIDQPPLNGSIELAEFVAGIRAELNRPARAPV